MEEEKVAHGANAQEPISSSEQEEEHTSPPDPLLDSGIPQDSKESWPLVFGGFLVFFNIWGLPLSYGAFQDYYTLSLFSSYSPSSISWIGTVQSALLVATGIFAGPFYDLGYMSALYCTGAFLMVFGMMMLSLSTQYYQIFLTQGICVGLGCGLLFVPVMTIIGAAFTKHRAIGMGIATSGIALGGVIFTIVYLRLLPTLGFPWMVRVIAFINLAVFALAAPMLLPHKQKPSRARQLFDKAALTDGPFLLFTTIQFFVFTGYLIPLFYLPTYAQVVLGADETTSLYILIGAQAGSLFGRLLATYPVRYIGVMIPWATCCSISGILCFAWIAVSTQASFTAFAVLYGFFSGSLVALPPSLFPKICPDPSKLGSRFGVSWMATAVACLVGTPIAGAIVDVGRRDFVGAQAFAGACLVLSAGFMMVLWVWLGRRQGTVWI